MFSRWIGGVWTPRPQILQSREAARSEMGLLGQYYDAAKRALFSIGMLILVFSAFRNSVAQYMGRFWYSSHSFWTYIWGVFYSLSGESDFVMAVLCELYLKTSDKCAVVFDQRPPYIV